MNLTRISGALLVVLFATASPAQQAERDIYADPQNLQVLPKDITSAELSNSMRGFAMGLGVRCETCHVGEPNTPLHTFDFESDEKSMKQMARIMITMMQDINGSHVPGLNEIEDSTRVAVRCVTCHRGLPQPTLIEDVLDAQLQSDGVNAALAEYNKLRDQYYGSHSYDFSEFTLPMYAQRVAASGNVEAATALVRLNTDNFPESYYSHFLLAELYSEAGEVDVAIEAYESALQLNPRAKPMIDTKIAEIRAR